MLIIFHLRSMGSTKLTKNDYDANKPQKPKIVLNLTLTRFWFWSILRLTMHLFVVKVTVNFLLSLGDSVQADDRIRIEKRDSAQFEYPTAMLMVNNLYGSMTLQTAEDQEKGNCLLFHLRMWVCVCTFFVIPDRPLHVTLPGRQAGLLNVELSGQPDMGSACGLCPVIEKLLSEGRAAGGSMTAVFRLEAYRTHQPGPPCQIQD